MRTNKKKIINDPVHGFITIPSELHYDIIVNPWFQRLTRIKQLGLTSFVYPGANHSRFQHALGAMYLMELAIQSLRSKGVDISSEEAEAVSLAILLHDIGHGPFSHALEDTIVEGITHEHLSVLIMEKLNMLFYGQLSMAIDIFKGNYKKKFLHQLVSSQLDMDRLDYLKRDSFFTGVIEGTIGTDRIIKMLNIKDDRLVVDIKGIYSIEKFLIARRLMYWQVYLHKTVISAEMLLVKILERAKCLAIDGANVFAMPAFSFFLNQQNSWCLEEDHFFCEELLSSFCLLDDTDIISCIKIWRSSNDIVLAYLCNCFLDRKLFKIEIMDEPFSEQRINVLREKATNFFQIPIGFSEYLVFSDFISNNTYTLDDERIEILGKDGNLKDISDMSDILNTSVRSGEVRKYYLCYPREIC